MRFIQKCFWNYILPLVLSLILYPYIKSIRVKIIDKNGLPWKQDKDHTHIYAHFHEDIPMLSLKYSFSNFCTMASRSRDGELIARVLSLLGYTMVRGSSKFFGGEALKSLIISLKMGKNLALAVDGPKGPRQYVKGGILLLASKAEATVIPVAGNAKHKIIFQKSWDHMWLPLPFSTAVIVCGEPVSFSNVDSKEKLTDKKNQIQTQLLDLKNQANNYFV